MTPIPSRLFALRMTVVVIVLITFAAGCSPTTTGSVEGRVTFKGKPVGTGLVVFIDPDGHATLPVAVEADGTFRIPKVPIGAMRVSFDNPPPPSFPAAVRTTGDEDPEITALREQAKRFIATPLRYKDPASSGLSFEIHGGVNTCHLDLQER